jgi:hypothetical protein
MICINCRTAGTQLTQSGDSPWIAELHKACKGGTWCDCQHSTEPLVKRKND